jgi:hypothetical protein
MAVAGAGRRHSHRREAPRLANEVGEKLKTVGVRVYVDVRNEKVNVKIGEHAMQRVKSSARSCPAKACCCQVVLLNVCFSHWKGDTP